MEATTSTLLMRDRLAAVLERIDKELDRCAKSQLPGTEYVGGVTRLGAALDQYLLEVWRWVCARHAVDPQVAAGRISAGLLLDRASAGQLRHLLMRPEAHSLASEAPVRWVLAEMREGSALDRALHLRNAIVHGRQAPDSAAIRRALEPLRLALAPQLALLEAR